MTPHHSSSHESTLEFSRPTTTESTCDPTPSPSSLLSPPLAASASSRQALIALSDRDLLAQLSALVKAERGLTVAILLHLAEVERRGLHLTKGSSSLFAYCVQRLGFSEDVAYKRVGAARYARRFPIVLDLVAQGALHLSALMLIGPHLTDGNHHEWLVAACGKTKREVERLVASRCPKPDVLSSVRKLPERQPPSDDEAVAPPSQQAQAWPNSGTSHAATGEAVTAVNGGCPSGVGATQPSSPAATQTDAVLAPQPTVADTQAHLVGASQSAMAVGVAQPSGSDARPADRPRVQPLSGSNFRVVFTAGEALKQKLDRAGELCSHSVAPGDLPALLERALDLLIEREEKRRFAVHSPKAGSAKRPSEPRISRSRLSLSLRDPKSATSVEAERQSPSVAPQQDPDPATSVEADWRPIPLARPQDPDPVEVVGLKHLVRESSRHVPAAVRRAVWERDGGQCTFVDDEGNRCSERRFLQIDHVVAHARGGPTAIENCRILCRSHNQNWAEVTFGSNFMDRARSRPRTR